MSLISDHKERTAPLTGQELAIIEDEDGLRGIRTELLRGLQGDKGDKGDLGDPGPMPDLASPGPIGGTTPDAGTFNQLNIKATSSAATLGPELITNGTFTGNADGWTLGQNWAYGTNNVVLTLDAAAEGTLSQSIPGIESEAPYLVTWTQTHSVANNGTVRVRIGSSPSGTGFIGVGTNATTQARIVTANSSGDLSLSFTPTQESGGTGTITIANVSAKKISPIASNIDVLDANGTVKNEFRATASQSNTLMGSSCGRLITTGQGNTGIGFTSLRDTITGNQNTAAGNGALLLLTSGEYNSAFGYAALVNNNGSNNAGFGQQALYDCRVGNENSAFGGSALYSLTTGSMNVAVGRKAGLTEITANTLKSASFCTFIGAESGFGSTVQYDGATAIGYRAKVTSANTVVLGRTTDNTVLGATGDDGSGDKLQVTGKARASAGGRFGSATDNLSISASGHVTLNGAATYWDDMLVEMRESLKGTNAKPDWDATNLGLLFPQNDPSEYIMLNLQLPHRWKEGSTIFPHVHIHQAANQNPVFKLDYRWINFGESVPATWSTYIMDSLATAYTSGTLSNILKGAGISGTGKTISSILQMKLYRDDNVYTGDLLATSFDIHIECDSLGSNSEYTKA